MDGVTKVIEELGGIIAEQEIELQKRQEIIDKLNKKIDLFNQYIEVYEDYIKRREM